MKRPYLTFLFAVVLPAGVALFVAGRIASDSWTELYRASHARVAHMVLTTLEQEVGAATEALLRRAEPVAEVDRREESVRRALGGDTVAALAVVGGELRLSVVLPDAADPTSVRFRQEALVPATTDRVGRAAGYAVSIYLNGRRWSSSDPAAGPEELGDSTVRAAASRADGVALGDGPAAPVAVAMGAPEGAPPALVSVVQPLREPPQAVPPPVLLVVALLLLFSALAGWIQLARPSGEGRGRPHSRSSMLLLSFVPALTVLVFIVHLDRAYGEATAATLSRDLGRVLAVARSQGLQASTDGVRRVSGFHASRVRSGTIEATTYAGDPAGLAGLPTPPPSFTASGRVDTPEGPAFFAGSRLGDGSVMVVTAPVPADRAAALRSAMSLVGGALGVWLLGVGIVAATWGRPRPPGSAPLDDDRVGVAH